MRGRAENNGMKWRYREDEGSVDGDLGSSSGLLHLVVVPHEGVLWQAGWLRCCQTASMLSFSLETRVVVVYPSKCSKTAHLLSTQIKLTFDKICCTVKYSKLLYPWHQESQLTAQIMYLRLSHISSKSVKLNPQPQICTTDLREKREIESATQRTLS